MSKTDKYGNGLLNDNIEWIGQTVADIHHRLKNLEGEVKLLKSDVSAHAFQIESLYNELVQKEQNQ